MLKMGVFYLWTPTKSLTWLGGAKTLFKQVLVRVVLVWLFEGSNHLTFINVDSIKTKKMYTYIPKVVVHILKQSGLLTGGCWNSVKVITVQKDFGPK